MTKKFKKGDVVSLKSGGPKMTVVDYHIFHDILSAFTGGESKPSKETEVVNVVYFDGAKSKKGQFHQDLLDLA